MLFQTVICVLGRDVLFRLWITVLLCHAKVNNVNNVLSLAARPTDEEVVGLDISIDEILLVYSLNTRQHLLCNHYHRLYREASVAVIEEVF